MVQASGSASNIAMQRALREELGILPRDIRQAFSGFEFRVLFHRYGYIPHSAFHVVDPRDGREKLVMADPHNRFSAIIYDPRRDEIEWEYKVPGTAVPNPHEARIITEDMPAINAEAGDVLTADRDNRIIVVDRDTKNIKYSLAIPGAGQIVATLVAKDKGGFVLSDYLKRLAKVRFDGTTVWEIAKGSFLHIHEVEGNTASGIHRNTFGGDYCVALNEFIIGLYEVRDSDGGVAWRVPPSDVPPATNVFLVGKPSACMPWGMGEGHDSLRVASFEWGGGIVALDKFNRPKWGVVRPFAIIGAPDLGVEPVWSSDFSPSPFGLVETTHVFPTLRGTIGFVDYMAKYSSVVGEVLRVPSKQHLAWMLAWDHDPSDSWFRYDPVIEVMNWDVVTLFFVNVGGNSLDYEVYGTGMVYLADGDFPSVWERIASGSVAAGGITRVDVDARKYVAVRVRGKRTTAGAGSGWKIFVVQQRS